MKLIIPFLLQRFSIIYWRLGALVISKQLTYSLLHLLRQYNHTFLRAYDLHLYPIAFFNFAQEWIIKYLELLYSLDTRGWVGVQEVDEFEVFADGKIRKEGFYHLFVCSKISLIYLHHQDPKDQLQLYLELLF